MKYVSVKNHIIRNEKPVIESIKILNGVQRKQAIIEIQNQKRKDIIQAIS